MTFKTLPIMPLTLPMRPPFLRYSNVFSEKKILELTTLSLKPTRISTRDFLAATNSAAAMVVKPAPMPIFRVSIMWTSSPSYSSPSKRIALYVPLSALDMVTTIAVSYPSATIWSKVLRIKSGDGSEVVGISSVKRS